MSAYRDRIRAERRYKRERLKAVRPLKEMLAGTYFRVRYPAYPIEVAIVCLGSGWMRTIKWEDCSDRALVALLQSEMIAEVNKWIGEVEEQVVLL